jgi:hypothetical protein
VEHQLSDLFALVHDNEAHGEVCDTFNRLDSQWNKLHGMVPMVEDEKEEDKDEEDDQDWEKIFCDLRYKHLFKETCCTEDMFVTPAY